MGTVSNQGAIVEDAAECCATEDGRIVCERAVVQRARVCASTVAVVLGDVTTEDTLAQRAAIHAATGRAAKVSRDNTVGNRRAFGFTEQSTTGSARPKLAMGTTVCKREAEETGALGQIHAPVGMFSVDNREPRAIDA